MPFVAAERPVSRRLLKVQLLLVPWLAAAAMVVSAVLVCDFTGVAAGPNGLLVGGFQTS